MSQISRLKETEIANGNLINANDLDAELDQLVSESNSQDTRLTVIESGNLTISGNKSFSAPVLVDELRERTLGLGIKVESVRLISGSIRLGNVPNFTCVANGEIGYDATNHVYRLQVNDVGKYLVHEGNPVLYKGGISGTPPLYTTSSSVTLKSGLSARSAANDTDIALTADISLSLNSSGLNGLDTGTKAANTWYYVYLVKRSIDGATGALFSTSNEAAGASITLPSGYDTKRQLPLAIRTDASSNILPFFISAGWPYQTTVIYRLPIQPVNKTPVTGQPIVLDGGTASTYTDVSLASFVPPISRQAILKGGIYQISASGKTGFIRKKGESGDEWMIQNVAGRTFTDFDWAVLPTDANQTIEYKLTDNTSGMDVNVQGYIVTEVN